MGKRFSTGEVVQLKEGGPPMLVETILPQQNEIECSWMKEGVVIKKRFPKTDVERASKWRQARMLTVEAFMKH